LVSQVEDAIKEEVAIVKELSEVASQHPYYKCVITASFKTSIKNLTA